MDAKRQTTIWLILLSLSITAFIMLAWWSGSDWGQRLDQAILRALLYTGEPVRPLGPDWLREAGRDLTALGSISVLAFMSLAIGGWLALKRRWRSLAALLLTIVPGVLLSFGLKMLFSQPRPDFLPEVTRTFTSSFPSSHAMASLIVYLALAAVIAQQPGARAVRGYLLLMALAASLIAGFSRLYLSVHWPSDVLAGWLAALAWLALVALGLQRLKAWPEPERRP
ncbi:MAG: phosphatase PAP2 family protein [Wenzhouxiangella sp.]